MGVFRCTLPDGSWDNLETADETLAALYERLSQFGMVLGSQLRTVPTSDRGVRAVIGRTAVIVTPKTYVQIADATVRFVEEAA